MGESLMTAMSAAISALDCPPLKIVSWCPGWIDSPVSVLAMSITRSTVSELRFLLLACILRNSSTVISARKCMFCESWAIRFFLGSVRISLPGAFPFIRILRRVGVSPCESCSISQIKVLLPEPVGPTIPIISPGHMRIFSTSSFAPDLSIPHIIVSS